MKSLKNFFEVNTLLCLVLLSACLFLCANQSILITDPVESNYTLSAHDMIQANDFFSPRIYGHVWFDKPIFFYLELIAAFKVFGENEFAARFFPALFGVLGVCLTYFFAKKIFDKKTAVLSSLIQLSAFGYWLVSKTVITDMTLFVFFNGILVFFLLAYLGDQKKIYYACYVFSGLAVLTKGPIGILLPGLIVTIFIVMRRDWAEIKRMKPLGFILFFLIVACWYVPMVQIHGDKFLQTFLGVHNFLRATQSEHPMWDVWWYYSVLFLLMFFPWSFLLLRKFFQSKPWQNASAKIKTLYEKFLANEFDPKILFLIIWALTINLFFQNMATKYSTYTLPCVLPVSILTARIFLNQEILIKRIAFGWSVILLLLAFFVAVPQTNHFALKSTADFLNANTKKDDVIAVFGDYSTSLVYYGKFKVYWARWQKDLDEENKERLEGILSWSAKNVMPMIAMEKLPRDKNIYFIVHKNRYLKIFYDDQSWRPILREFTEIAQTDDDVKVFIRKKR